MSIRARRAWGSFGSYREAMPQEQALAIIEAEIGRAIDSECFEGLRTIVGA